ncbi:hypothetical protein CROQUDRAFT_516174 [Cronartium quercuum f. sp. fusiforme G11]|uniref:Uncharacterized protein n=1 Tax=Cronartium quercuum f. sp. fusiforme G11 TaxID=708437 RepID=A0A9P6NI86_9BASI|nr:hypothetical protein CROQUDRAFT_516174 [Cronartium quercuum f. sp. fusiforme G11]
MSAQTSSASSRVLRTTATVSLTQSALPVTFFPSTSRTTSEAPQGTTLMSPVNSIQLVFGTPTLSASAGNSRVSSSFNLDRATIACIVVGAILGFVGIGLCIFAWRVKTRRRNHPNHGPGESDPAAPTTPYLSDHHGPAQIGNYTRVKESVLDGSASSFRISSSFSDQATYHRDLETQPIDSPRNSNDTCIDPLMMQSIRKPSKAADRLSALIRQAHSYHDKTGGDEFDIVSPSAHHDSPAAIGVRSRINSPLVPSAVLASRSEPAAEYKSDRLRKQSSKKQSHPPERLSTLIRQAQQYQEAFGEPEPMATTSRGPSRAFSRHTTRSITSSIFSRFSFASQSFDIIQVPPRSLFHTPSRRTYRSAHNERTTAQKPCRLSNDTCMVVDPMMMNLQGSRPSQHSFELEETTRASLYQPQKSYPALPQDEDPGYRYSYSNMSINTPGYDDEERTISDKQELGHHRSYSTFSPNVTKRGTHFIPIV